MQNLWVIMQSANKKPATPSNPFHSRSSAIEICLEDKHRLEEPHSYCKRDNYLHAGIKKHLPVRQKPNSATQKLPHQILLSHKL